jgi:6-phosphogluconolactonase
MLRRASLVAVLLLGGAAVLPLFAQQDLLVYFGTYTRGLSKGIYVSRLNLATGALSAPQLASETPNPSFLAVRSRGDFLYAVNEVNTFEGKPTGSVSGFAIDKASGKLTPLNQRSSGGAGPAHLSVDRDERTVLVANYGGGSVQTLPIGPDGHLGGPVSFVQHHGSSVNPERQREPHAHEVLTDPTNQFAYVADLGLDKVMIYRFDAAAHTLTANTPDSAALTPGSGPRHMAIGATGRFIYVINELKCTVTAFSRDVKTGALTEIQTVSSLPPGVEQQKGFSTAEIHLSPSGSFLYGSNRGHDSVSVWSVDRGTGRIAYVANTPTQGKTPRGFEISPDGDYLIAGNQDSDSVVVFRIDKQRGTLTPAGSPITVGAPVDVKFCWR